MQNKVRLSLNAVNRGCYTMKKIFSSKLRSKKLKRNLYNVYLCFIPMYYSELCSTTKCDETKLLIFERKVFIKVQVRGPIYNTETGQYKIITNTDTKGNFEGPNKQKTRISEIARINWTHTFS